MYSKLRQNPGAEPFPGIVRDEDGALLSPGDDSPAWRAYQDWLAQGNVPAEPEPLPPFPDPVPSPTPAQLATVLGLTEAQALKLMALAAAL